MWIFWLIFSLWVVFIITPLILGLFGRITFRGVIIWEMVAFLPIILFLSLTYGIIALVLLPKGTLNTQRIRDLYIPKMPRSLYQLGTRRR